MMRPVISRLFAIPHLRARYIAHIRTIADEWLDWDVLQPMIAEYQSLVDAEVKEDDKKLYAYEAFATSQTKDQGGGAGGGRGRRATPSFKRFVKERAEYLLNHPEVNKPTPTIASVSNPEKPMANQPVQITAKIDGDVKVSTAILYYADGAIGNLSRVCRCQKMAQST